jgi:hypothetical protein
MKLQDHGFMYVAYKRRVQDNQLRSDLYYRLNAGNIRELQNLVVRRHGARNETHPAANPDAQAGHESAGAASLAPLGRFVERIWSISNSGAPSSRQHISPNGGAMQLVIDLMDRSLSFLEGSEEHRVRVPLLAGPAERRFGLLRHIRRLLKPGGKILITNPRPADDLSLQWLNLWGRMTQDCGPLPRCEELSKSLKEAGFVGVRGHRLVPGTNLFSFKATRPDREV